MKKGLIRLGILTIVAVFAYSCAKKTDSTGADASSEERVAAGDIKIAFVYTDSVINKYDYFKKKSEETKSSTSKKVTSPVGASLVSPGVKAPKAPVAKGGGRIGFRQGER